MGEGSKLRASRTTSNASSGFSQILQSRTAQYATPRAKRGETAPAERARGYAWSSRPRLPHRTCKTEPAACQVYAALSLAAPRATYRARCMPSAASGCFV